jgi:hypothetical protein
VKREYRGSGALPAVRAWLQGWHQGRGSAPHPFGLAALLSCCLAKVVSMTHPQPHAPTKSFEPHQPAETPSLSRHPASLEFSVNCRTHSFPGGRYHPRTTSSPEQTNRQITDQRLASPAIRSSAAAGQRPRRGPRIIHRAHGSHGFQNVEFLELRAEGAAVARPHTEPESLRIRQEPVQGVTVPEPVSPPVIPAPAL